MLYALFVVLFSYRVSGAVTLLAKVAALLVAFAFLVRLLKGSNRLVVPKEYQFLFAWFIVALVSSAIAVREDLAFARAFTLAQVMPLAFVISNFVIWNQSVRFVWRSLAIAALVSGVMALLAPGQFASMDGRVYATLGNSNLFAVLLSAVMCVLLGEFAKSRSLMFKIGIAVLACFYIFMIAASGSRKGLFGVALVALIAVVFFVKGAGRKSTGQAFLVILVATLSLSAVTWFISQGEHFERVKLVAEVLETGDMRQGDESLAGRLFMYKRGMEMFLDNPIFGVGLENFQTAQSKTFGTTIGTYSHSNYIEILTNTGLIGFCLYFAIYAMIFRKLYRCRWMMTSSDFGSRYITVVAIALVFLTYDFAMVGYYEKLIWIVYAGVIGETELLYRETRKRWRLQQLERSSA